MVLLIGCHVTRVSQNLFITHLFLSSLLLCFFPPFRFCDPAILSGPCILDQSLMDSARLTTSCEENNFKLEQEFQLLLSS